MSTDLNLNPDGTPVTPSGTPPPAPSDIDVKIPKVRFDEVNDRMKKAEAELDKLKATQAKADEDRLNAEKKFEELATKRATERDEWKAKAEALETTLGDYEKRLHAVADARVMELPEKLRAKVPGADKVPAADRLARIEELLEIAKELNVAPAPGNGPSPRPAGAPDPARSAAEVASMAESHVRQKRSYAF